MNMEFQTVEQLYQRLSPALRTKKRELHRLGYQYIKEEDIWNYLKQSRWSKSHDLMLSEMVNDILNTDNKEFDLFIKKQMEEKNREVYFKDLEVL